MLVPKKDQRRGSRRKPVLGRFLLIGLLWSYPEIFTLERNQWIFGWQKFWCYSGIGISSRFLRSQRVRNLMQAVNDITLFVLFYAGWTKSLGLIINIYCAQTITIRHMFVWIYCKDYYKIFHKIIYLSKFQHLLPW